VGLFFNILAVPPDQIYERRGRIRRKGGIQPQWFHHPEAVRVPEFLFSRFSTAFRKAHPVFNYYGPTEFKDDQIAILCSELQSRLVGSRDPQGETEVAIQKVLDLAEPALRDGLSLLVLGI
jgi:hypothetical protein